jgi:PAS domain S-box-containing protein
MASPPSFDPQKNIVSGAAYSRDWTQGAQALAVKILALLDHQIDSRETITEIVREIQKFTGFEAVGIRLRDGDDFPYLETRGFPDDFVKLENSLCARNTEGTIIRDHSGYPIMECMCGNVLQGRTDPSLPFFSQGGSFWTNCTTELLATSTEKDRQSRTRNRCNGEGYESVALIPLRSELETIGLLQLNDRRTGRFTIDMIGFLEGIGVSVAITLTHKRMKQDRERLFNLSTDMLSIGGLDGILTQVNPAFTRTLGWSVQEFTSKPWLEFVHPEDREETIIAGAKLKSGQEIHDFQNRYIHKNGSYRWISWNCFPIKEENLIFAVARDVTEQRENRLELDRSKSELEKRVAERTAELTDLNVKLLEEISGRKRSEQALLTAEEFCADLYENSPEMLISVSMESGKILQCNETLATRLGYSKNQIIGRRIDELYHSDNLEQAKEDLETLRRTGELNATELRVIKKDGTVLDVIMNAKTVLDDNGAVTHARGGWRDITELKKYQRVQRRLAAAIEQAAEAVVVTNSTGDIEYVNPSFERITGYGASEVLGERHHLFVKHPENEAIYQEVVETIFQGRNWRGTLTSNRKDGHSYEEEISVSPVFDVSGAIANFVVVKRDVSKEIGLQRQLTQAQKLEAIGTLAGGIAHDLNNLLQVVLGYSELIINNQETSDKQKKDLKLIHKAAKSGAELVKGLLMFSRKTETNLRPLYLNEQVIKTAKLLERTIPKMIGMELSLGKNIPVISADETQIEQVLMNLAVNSRDAMPDGGKLVIETASVRFDHQQTALHPQIKPGLYVRLSVNDNGHGMDEQTLEHIFEPFFTTKEIGKGTGLGLSAVYGIVQRHGGWVTCDSEPAKGTTFAIYFPALAPQGDQASLQSNERAPTGGSEMIFIVDDDDSIRSLSQRILTRSGYRVLEATNGKQALEIYAEHADEIDLIILDLIMPEMGGLQCLKEILSVRPGAKALIASGYSTDGLIEQALEDGAKGCVYKPYDINKFLEAVRSTLDSDK